MDNKLVKDIRDYCKANGLKYDEYVNKLVKKSFMLDKYGEKPPIFYGDSDKKQKITSNYVFHCIFEERSVTVESIVDIKFEKIETPIKKRGEKRKLT